MLLMRLMGLSLMSATSHETSKDQVHLQQQENRQHHEEQHQRPHHQREQFGPHYLTLACKNWHAEDAQLVPN